MAVDHGAQAMIPWPRDLYDSILVWHGRGPSLYWSVLMPWLEANSATAAWLQDFAARGLDGIPPTSHDELKSLYAFSRINDLLIHNFPPVDSSCLTPRPKAWDVTREEYESFFEALGFTILRPESYSPVFQEIVSVEQTIDRHHPIELLDEYWPTTMLGTMLFARGGAGIAAGSEFVDKAQAEKSTLLWAHRRAYRPCYDLSVEWGSNSQWRTDFRRDYVFGSQAHLNVDGTGNDGLDLDLDEFPLPELVLNRCAIKTDLGDYKGRAWPFGTRMTVHVEPINPT